MADKIKNLPETNDPASPIEINVMKEVIQAPTQQSPLIMSLRAYAIYASLFFILNLSITDSLLKNFITSGDLVLLLIKTVMFVSIIWVFTLTGIL